MPPVEQPSEARGAAQFATTHWSVVLRAGQADSSVASAALGRLYQLYCYPLYAYVRRQGHDPETAQDIVHEVFAAILEKKQLAAVSPDRGRFRSYLLSAVNHHLANEWHKRRRQKRGGGLAPISLDGLTPEERYRMEPVDTRTPAQLYERRWALTVLDGVLARLQADWGTAGKGATFDVLRVFLSGDGNTPSFAEVAAQLGWSEGAARVAVHRLRQQYRSVLREEIARTVDDPRDTEDELRQLLAALRG